MVVFAGDDPKFSNGTRNETGGIQPSAQTSVATVMATLKLTVKQ